MNRGNLKIATKVSGKGSGPNLKPKGPIQRNFTTFIILYKGKFPGVKLFHLCLFTNGPHTRTVYSIRHFWLSSWGTTSSWVFGARSSAIASQSEASQSLHFLWNLTLLQFNKLYTASSREDLRLMLLQHKLVQMWICLTFKLLTTCSRYDGLKVIPFSGTYIRL